MAETGAFAPLRYPPFRWLVSGRLITMLGNAVAPIALAFAVLDLTGSVRDLGLVVGVRSLANVVCVLFGGVVADRLPRQVVMVVSSLLAALSQASIAVLVLTGRASIGSMATIAAINGVVSAFAFPAASALIAQTVPDGIRRQANALNRLGINASLIVGAAVGGLLVAAVGPGWGLAVDALTFALAGVLFTQVKVTMVRDASAPGSSLLADLLVGWREFAARTWLWVVVLAYLFINAAWSGALGVLGPAIADDTIGRPAWGLVLAAETAGMVVGGLIALKLKVRRLLLFGAVTTFGMVPLLVTLGVAPWFWLLAIMAVLSGVAVEQFGIAWETTMQDHVPADKLARVYSYDMLGSIIAMPLGQVVAGPIAQAWAWRPR